MFSYDIAVTGPCKSCNTKLICSYLFNSPKGDTTYGNPSTKHIQVHNKRVTLRIYDDSGDPKLGGPLAKSLEKRKAYLVCFSVYDRKSFEEAGEYIKLVLLSGPRDAFFMLVGTHCDAKGNEEKSFYTKEAKTTEGNGEKTRQIAYDEAEAFASNLHWPYIETDTKSNMNVEEAFERVLKEMLVRFPTVLPVVPVVSSRKQPPRRDIDEDGDDRSCSIF